MSLVTAWLAFPLLLCLLSLGCGLLVERLTAIRLPGMLLLPLGFCLVIVVAQAATYWEASARAATPLVVVLAVIGFAASRERLRAVSPDLWAIAAAVGVFAIFGAPVILSGEATFAGYTVLGDTSVHFILIDRLMEHGRDLSDLGPSSYRAALDSYFHATAYPLGAHAALGAARPLVGQDVAWVFQPFLAFMAALTSLALYSLLGGFVQQRSLRAVIAFLGAQPALVYAYGLQGSIKEVGTVLIIALLVATVPTAVAGPGGVRRLIPLALAAAAGMAVIGLGIAPWLGPFLLACAAAIGWRRGSAWARPTLRDAAFFTVVTAALAFPILVRTADFLRSTVDVLNAQTELGNLLEPLHRLQAFGIWPEGDYRLPLDPKHLQYAGVLIGIGLAGGAFGLIWAWRRRIWLPVLYAGVSLIGWAYVTSRGSPWADAKALMIVSTPALVTMLLGAVALYESGRRMETALLVAAIGFGVLWSNALAYHDARLAPRDRMGELRQIGERIEGRGPTLYTEFEEFAKHFLRESNPTGWSETWQPAGVPRGRFGFAGDIDQVPVSYASRFRTLVLRRSPSASLPPSSFRRTFSGRYYEVWEREARPLVTLHVPFGGGYQPASAAGCAQVRQAGDMARREGGKLAYVVQPRRLVLNWARAQLPRGWSLDAQDPQTVHALGPGFVTQRLRVPASRSFDVWIQGSFGRATSVSIDGRPAGSVSYELNGNGQFAQLGRIELERGVHSVTISRGGGDLRPGNGGDHLLGPVVLVPTGPQLPVSFESSTRWRSLCGRRLDWVEAVR